MAVTHLQFTEAFGDARVEELKLLSAAAYGRLEIVSSSVPDGPWRDLLVSLVWNDLLTMFTYEWGQNYFRDGASAPNLADAAGIRGESRLERAMTMARIQGVLNIYENRPMVLQLRHSGRVRLSELKQALRASRERDPFGILWDVRHWEQDLQIAILEAGEKSALAVAYLDMNGLKQLNDTHGHGAGDLALKSYFQAVASSLGDRGQAYRLGGDEVLVLLPNFAAESAAKLVKLACTKVMNERLEEVGSRQFLSIAAGITCTTDSSALPVDLRAAADKVQYRAKERSKEGTPRPSVIAIEGEEQMMVLPHNADVT